MNDRLEHRARAGAHVAHVLPLLATLLLAAPLAAQTGRIQGTIKEAARPRGVRGASVLVARLDPEPPLAFGAKPDEQGHYHFDSLPVGRYMIQLTHEALDSLELSLPASEVFIAAGRTAEVPFSLPTSLALRDAVCRGLTVGKETGAVTGHVVDADTEQPLANADVALSWTDLSFDRKTLHANKEQHDNWVRTGPRGEYRICNVPIGSWLLIQLQYMGRAGNAVRVSVSGEEAVVVRNLSLSVSEAPTLTKLDSAGATVRGLDSEPSPDDSLAEGLYLTGTAAVSGVVLGDGGRPLDDVEVRVLNARPIAHTDAAGRFTLNNLPSGTQLLAVRRLGYLIGDVAVELRPNRTVSQNVLLRRVVSLDSMRVVARRSRYADFEYRRKNNPVGRFLTAGDLTKQHAIELAPVIQHVGGFTVVGFGPNTQVFSTAAKAGRPNCKEVNVVIDGVDQAAINMVPPHDIAAVEIYPEAAGAPGQYRSECGLILIWTKRWRSTPPT
ncbi:MAG: carboxypeptidase regulatory-like domain-containing protein [Gemmatimonadaceae bacterium]